MLPSPGDPARGIFVRDQVAALRRLPGLDVELFAFASAGAPAYRAAAGELRARYGGERFDVIHAHFGLTLWPALALRGAPHAVTLHGTDLVHPRSRAITLAALPFADLVAPVSDDLARLVPRRLVRGSLAVLPCGVDLERFRRVERAEARRRLGLARDARLLLFPADPARPEKRYDRALEVAQDVALLALEGVNPEDVPLWINAADAVLITSERESFGLAVLEALACDVPVLATPVGVAPQVLAGVKGTVCQPFDAETWRAALGRILVDPDPRVDGRPAVEPYSAVRMAEGVRAAWSALSGAED
jgi:teichuronic acid biosynthesis glycosyltransferase TuaC